MSQKTEKIKILFLIPARGGSQRLPRKNILILQGKPLIAWTIQAALASSYAATVAVSTDDPKIAAVAKKYGALIPFLRPKRLASSSARSVDVVLHALDHFKRNGKVFDVVVLLQPTSPLRTARDIDSAMNLFLQKKAPSVVSVCRAEHHPRWIGPVSRNGSMKNFGASPDVYSNGGLSPLYYRLNGAIYIALEKILRRSKKFVSKATYAYVMPAERSVDIDCGVDFELARILMRKN